MVNCVDVMFSTYQPPVSGAPKGVIKTDDGVALNPCDTTICVLLVATEAVEEFDVKYP